MTKKIFSRMFVSSAIVAFATVAIIMGVLYNYFNDRLVNELRLEADFIAEGVGIGGEDYLESLSDAKQVRVTLVSDDGRVLFDNTADPSEMENHLDREEIEEALKSGVGESVRYSNTLSEKTAYRAVRLSDGSVIRVSSTSISFLMLIVEMIRPMLLVLVIVLIVAAALSYRLSRQIVSPLNSIDLDNPEKAEVYDELSPMLSKISRQNHLIDRQIKELSRKKTELETVTKNMGEGLVMTDSRALVLLCNDSAKKLLGTKGDVSDNDIVYTLNRTVEFRQCVEQALAGKHFENVLSDEDHSYRVIANPVFDGDDVVGSVIIILDETEKERREVLRREFTSNVSHELKTPLTSISGFAELIRNGMCGKEDTVHFADTIYKEAQRLITLAEDIIRLSQLDEGQIMGGMNEVDLGEVAKDVCERLANVAQSKNVTLSLNAVSAKIMGNEPLLSELCYNICDNAIKYNVDGGKVDVEIINNAGKCYLSVKDTGIGIPEEHTERVFERFYRVDKSHSKETGGTGLGLSIVKHIAGVHNAHLTLDSEVGKGTTVTVAFDEAK